MNLPKPSAMPPQPTTKQIPAVKAEESAVLAELRAIRADVTVAIEEGRSTRSLVLDVAKDVETLKANRSAQSERVREVDARTSQSDMRQDAAIAQLVSDMADVKVEQKRAGAETAVQTAMLQALTDGAKTLAKNPTVHTIVVLIGAAIIAWLKGHL